MRIKTVSNILRRLVAVFLALAILPAHAQSTLTATAVMPVRMEVVTSCLVSVADLEFGEYISNSATPVLGQTSIQLQCGSFAVAEIALDAGSAPGRDTSRRKLVQDSGIDRMDYQLYQDAARTMIWGDHSGSDTKEVLSTGEVQSIPIYGEIPANQRVRDGSYSDIITVSVYY